MEFRLEGNAVIKNNDSEFLLEYYLIEDSEKNYGVKIDKKEKTSKGLVLCEEYVSNYTTDNEKEASSILQLLAKNIVTPTTADNVLQDLGYFCN